MAIHTSGPGLSSARLGPLVLWGSRCNHIPDKFTPYVWPDALPFLYRDQ